MDYIQLIVLSEVRLDPLILASVQQSFMYHFTNGSDKLGQLVILAAFPMRMSGVLEVRSSPPKVRVETDDW
jgi:hypothetical protein